MVDFVDIHDVALRVSEVVKGDAWRLDRLSTILPYVVKYFLLFVHVTINANIPNCYVWREDISSIYTTNTVSNG